MVSKLAVRRKIAIVLLFEGVLYLTLLFFIAISFCILFDLFMSQKNIFKINILLSLFWVILALLFNVFIFYSQGKQEALDFFTGYIIEKSLSIDNLFVFLLIFSEFQIPKHLQHRVLFLGMFGAIIFRAIMIYAGIELLNHFSWMSYFFGLLLLYAGISSLYKKTAPKGSKSAIIRFLKNHIPLTEHLHEEHFFIWNVTEARWYMTPLFLCLIMIECSDILFAIDSIPAILAITQNQYIVITSNIFALLGLRSLYFILEPLLLKLDFLHYTISALLCFIGIKFLSAPWYHISTLHSLIIITGIILVSLFFGKNRKN